MCERNLIIKQKAKINQCAFFMSIHVEALIYQVIIYSNELRSRIY
ncbi:hypothetical protein SAMN04244574_03549 [Azotobacter beijerinckii]|uniref:Uncharacterized protein n=1 Tax=Azotobacter beijerinckii TaxID=170623 RepID=A0A1I4FTX4_9GAMM|nr:hypothetical protein SAMN04244571_04444 [Azotobacter beijerinckii]SFL21284.1 hypothetical protein SAMN04244574_03549 [Azotobacter beijerinckii]